MMPTAVYIVFAFAFGACVGSFLNVVVWRLPRVEIAANDSIARALLRILHGLAYPPSRCPKCETRLSWRDNIPVFGWLALRGKCRYCGVAISARYPIVEALTGLLFVGFFLSFFVYGIGPCAPNPPSMISDETGLPVVLARPLSPSLDWPMFVLYLFLASSLVAAGLIDADTFHIPIEIPWLAAAVGVVAHGLFDHPSLPGALSVGPIAGAMSAGGAVGLVIALILYRLGVIPQSFSGGEPLLEVEREELAAEIEAARRENRTPEHGDHLPPAYTRNQIRAEIGKEMLFLLPPLGLAALCGLLALRVPAANNFWMRATEMHWVAGVLGALLGAMVGGFVVWFFRMAGTIAFGRVAMGLGDVHLMFGVGAVLGAGPATVAFFVAPFFAILIAVWMLLTGKRRELPFGPYLSMATILIMVVYCPLSRTYLAPGADGIVFVLRRTLGV